MASEREHLELLARIATHYFIDHLSQQQIAAQLGYSRSMISRLLTEAEQQGVVEIRIHYPLERCFSLESELRSSLGLTDVQVLARGSLSYDQMLRRLGAMAARFTEELVIEGMTLGVSWGTALREITNALNPHAYTGIKVVQIIGALDTPDPDIDGPDLARNFARLFGGQYFTLPAPLIVDSETTRDALLGDQSLKRVLAHTEDMQIVLMGVGTVDRRRSSLVRSGYLSYEDLAELSQLGAVGDVCAIHFDIQGNILDIPLNRRRIGISPEQLARVPIKIGVAGGEAKALSIVGACRAGLVNHLITDETAALRALRAIEGDE
jgi:DNA-binding transcriptional regulator LsrR (DeoR family)